MRLGDREAAVDERREVVVARSQCPLRTGDRVRPRNRTRSRCRRGAGRVAGDAGRSKRLAVLEAA